MSTIALRAGLMLAVLLPIAESQTVFRPAAAGCAMAHCDSTMSDRSAMPPLLGNNVDVLAHDIFSAGSGKGLGCVSNGSTAVCSYQSKFGDSVIAYDATGRRLWTSGSLLNRNAYTSAPMIDAAGNVIAADDAHLIQFGPDGSVVWQTATAGGIPISPVQTADGTLFLATHSGPVSIHDPSNGALLNSVYLYLDGSNNYFETANTPCVINNRVFVSTQLHQDTTNGRLYALDIDPTDPLQPIKVAWHWSFKAPSGASPTCIGNTIYFDGAGFVPGLPNAPSLFAVRDDGDHPTMVWAQSVRSKIPASVASDPRGGIWVISAQYPKVQRRRLDTGVVVDSYNLNSIFADGWLYQPSSALTISGTSTQPVLTLGVSGANNPFTYVISIDLASRQVLWKQSLCSFNDQTAGQFPTLQTADGKPIVVFSTWKYGAYFVGQP